MNGEFEGMWKESVVAQSCKNSDIYLKELSKTSRHQSGQPMSRLGYEPETPTPLFSVSIVSTAIWLQLCSSERNLSVTCS